MTKVLITGVNGFLATNIAIELLSRGYSVIGTLRNLNSFKYPLHPKLKLVQGDFTDKEFLEKTIAGCDYVIHAAAITDQSLPRYKDYHKVNVVAVEEMISIAIRKKVKRLVYISSANAFGHGSKDNPGDENSPIRKPFSCSYYAISKLRGQQVLLDQKDNINVVVLNPSFMLGPYDSKPSSGKIILMGYSKKIVFYPPGGKSFVHVQDVAKAVVKAMEKGKNGECFLITNENLSYREFFQKLSGKTGKKPVLIKIPEFMLMAAGLVGSFIRLFGFKTELSLTNMRILCARGYYANQKAVNELSLSLRSTEAAIEDAVNWFAESKMIRR